MTFNLHSPAWLWLFLLIPLLWWMQGRRGDRASIVFSSTALAKSISKGQRARAGQVLAALRFVSLALFILALARPQIGKGYSEVESSGVDIVLTLDISSSMLALDFSTKEKLVTRIAAAKEVLANFIRKRPHDRLALVVFSGESYLVSPLTLNHDWLLNNLERIHVGMVEDGTAIGSALGMSVNRLRELPAKSKLVILLTDGANNMGKISPQAAAEAASSYGIKVYTVALGKEGMVSALYLDRSGNIARNAWGEPDIIPAQFSADPKTLKQIAEITGGQAFQGYNKKELEAIYEEIDKLEKTDAKLRHFASYTELFPYCVLLGMLTLIWERYLGNTRLRTLP